VSRSIIGSFLFSDNQMILGSPILIINLNYISCWWAYRYRFRSIVCGKANERGNTY